MNDRKKAPIPDSFPAIYIAPRKKFCERCGRLIPNNGYETDADGRVLTDDKGHAIEHKNPRLVCECWAEVVPPKPRLRRKKGQRDQNQLGFEMKPGAKVG